FTDRARGTRDVLFQDGAFEHAQHRHADHRRGVGGGDRLAGFESEICVGGAQNHAHHQAEHDGSPGELLHLHALRHKGPEFGGRHESLDLTLSLSVLPSTVLPANFACTAFITTPICLMEAAPVSAIAAVTASSISSSLAPAGR